MSDAHYNTTAGIEARLATIADLHALFKERHVAGYERRESMREFVVLGRFGLDTCGNAGPCEFEVEYPRTGDASWLAASLPRVIETSELLRVVGGLRMTTSHGGGPVLPPVDATCGECGRGWTLDTAHDVASHSKSVMHSACAAFAGERTDLAEYRAIADEAGLQKWILTPTPNNYTKEGAPWAAMRSVAGTITIGWRKRVINIDWSDVVARRIVGLEYERRRAITEALSGATLFAGEDSTRGDYYVHAWTRDKAVGHLRAIVTAVAEGRDHGE